jgi:hypothetical protein
MTDQQDAPPQGVNGVGIISYSAWRMSVGLRILEAQQLG